MIQNVRILTLLVSVLSLLSIGGYGRAEVSTIPERSGISERTIDKIRTELNQFIAKGEIVGCVALIARHGKIVFYEAFGQQDREKNISMHRHTLFWIGSLTKIVTGAAAAILVEEGRLDLDAPLSRYLPGFSGIKVLQMEGDRWKKVPPRQPLTIRHLAAQTSGLTTGWFRGDRVDALYHEKGIFKDNATVAEFVDKLAQIPLKYHPGEVWEYSVSATVLGRVIEVCSGQTLDRFFNERIFKPLKMQDTGFWFPETKHHRFATEYVRDDNGKAKLNGKDPRGRRFVGKQTFLSGGWGLVSSAQDYYRFLQTLLNRGELEGIRILKPASVAAMTSDQIGDARISARTPWVAEHGFGLGLAIWDAPGGKGKSLGWSGSLGTWAWVNFDMDMVGVFMVHLKAHEHDHANRFYRLAHEAIID